MIAFTPSRLTVARMRRGLSMFDLAALIKVTTRAVSGYESGEYPPAEKTLDELTRVLGFSREFFSGRPMDLVSPDGASFRSLSTMTAGEKGAALAAAAIAIEINGAFESAYNLPSPNVPDLRQLSPEEAASELRSQWKLGARSITNVLHVAEVNGVRMFSLSDDCARTVDGFSLWSRHTPFIFLNPRKSGERGRYDCSHELGHLVLHQHGGPRGCDAEREADRFASAFLMPRESVLPAAPSLPADTSLVELKAFWKVSVAAMARRLVDLGLISQWQYKTLCTEIARRGWRTAEPQGIPRETSLLLSQIFADLRAGGATSRAKFAHRLGLTVVELDSFAFGLVPVALKGGGVETARQASNLRLVTKSTP